MKILIVDRDDVSAGLIRSKLEAEGHKVLAEASKNEALDKVTSDHYDVMMLDPAPLTSARPVILNLRRNIKHYPYIFLMSQNFSQEEAIRAGANELLKKPLDAAVLESKMDNAGRLIELVGHIGDDSEDFPSAGGIIAKSAFNQLFISALDRADRYGEKTFLLFIAVDNFDEILQMDGTYAAEYGVAKLSQYLVRLRRQSDIIGQTARYEFALLLQRPGYDTEPEEAAMRFADSLAHCEESFSGGSAALEISVKLIEIPVGTLAFNKKITFEK